MAKKLEATNRVLVVDDEPDLLTLMQLTLTKLGLEVVTADSRQSAIEALDRQSYALCLTDMQLGDGVLFYHSSCPEPGVAGLALIAGPPVADRTQFDPSSSYFDPKASADKPRWVQLDVRLARKTRLLPLREMRGAPELATMRVLAPGNRLSITPVTPQEWRAVGKLLAR